MELYSAKRRDFSGKLVYGTAEGPGQGVLELVAVGPGIRRPLVEISRHKPSNLSAPPVELVGETWLFLSEN